MDIADFVHEMSQVIEFRGIASEITCHRNAIEIHGETRVRLRGVKEIDGSEIIVFDRTFSRSQGRHCSKRCAPDRH